MYSEEQNLKTIALAENLLQKGIAFCLYRFPDVAKVELAIQKGIIPSGTGPGFIIHPFSESEAGIPLFFDKCHSEKLPEEFFEKLSSIKNEETVWNPLPQEEPKDVYLKRIQHYLENIKSQKIQKAILSRIKKVAKPSGFNPFYFYKKLIQKYPEAFVSLFYWPGKGMWAGATTELLLHKQKELHHTMALAATQLKRKDGNYNWREKERKEHELVQQHIKKVFKDLLYTEVQSKGPYTIEAGKVVHLRTDYTFTSQRELQLKNLISCLHPTPAIGGLPVNESLAIIKKYEGYNRQYYAGYLGEMNWDETARLYINLRCMQIGEKEIALYVGGGISADSDPEEEWEETNQKSLTLLEIIEAGKIENEII